MNSLDLFLVIIVIAYALSGYVQGFLCGLASSIGLLVGGGLAIVIVPRLIKPENPTLTTSFMALVLVLVLAIVGQALGTMVGNALRASVNSQPLRSMDSVAGSGFSMVAALVVAWALGFAVSGSQIPYLSEQVRSSAVLDRVDAVMPKAADESLQSFAQLLDTGLFPRYLEPFEKEQIVSVEPPDPEVLKDPEVRKAGRSVVKVTGNAAKCNRGIEGSGFVFAPERVMTNAHVVAGVDRPTVLVGGRRYDARVVVFDPDIDVAVLRVDGLDVTPLKFDATGESGDTGAVLGFPENGPFDARAARIRTEQTLRSPDIYDNGTVLRQAFSIRSLVRSGNSGGPLVSGNGRVYGVIFAASVSDSATGYALTADQVSASASKGRTATSRVSTGGCA
ncbi:MarP family serine protease [soil metagenome]